MVHNDRAGVIAAVANVLAAKSMNIGHMEVSRKEKGQEALMVIFTSHGKHLLIDTIRIHPNHT